MSRLSDIDLRALINSVRIACGKSPALPFGDEVLDCLRELQEWRRTGGRSIDLQSGAAPPTADTIAKPSVPLASNEEVYRRENDRLRGVLNQIDPAGLRRACQLIALGPPTELANDEVASWAASIANSALAAALSDETTKDPVESHRAVQAMSNAQLVDALLQTPAPYSAVLAEACGRLDPSWSTRMQLGLTVKSTGEPT